jgi:ketosteroid isomerase-like protein
MAAESTGTRTTKPLEKWRERHHASLERGAHVWGSRVKDNLIAVISKEEVQEFYDEFLWVLKTGDIALLERIYADDYLLVRPNGDTFGKQEILADLRRHSMKFTSFEVRDVLIRTKGFVGIFTADVRSTAVRDGVEIRAHARQLAIVSKENERTTISHFQSTNIADSK